MTSTREPTSRVTETAFNVLGKGVEHCRPIVVTLHGDHIHFRNKGQKHGWRLPIDKGMRYALLHDVPVAKGLEQEFTGPGFVEPEPPPAPAKKKARVKGDKH